MSCDFEDIQGQKMSEYLFMVDIETTGTKLEDNILQIAILQLEYTKQKYLRPKELFNFYQNIDHGPPNNWAKEHQSELYEKCQKSPKVEPEDVREDILKFFSKCYSWPPVKVIGKNVATFDMPRLVYHGYMKESHHVIDSEGNQSLKGDFHYRLNEISGLIYGLELSTGKPRNAIIDAALAIYPEIRLPEEVGLHDAVYDCYMQTRLYNGLLTLMRMPGKVV